MDLESLISKSKVTVETRKIIRARASLLFPSLPNKIRHKEKSEGKISNEEFTEKLEESKMDLESLISKSKVTVETRKIIRARASLLFPSLPNKIRRKEKSEEKNKK